MTRSGMALVAAASLMLATAADARGQEIQGIRGGGGLHVAVYEAGNPAGPPIVFLHGFLGTHLAWGNQFAGPLAAEFRLVALDLRGHGASDKPLEAEHYTSSALWAEDVAAVIREKKLDRPVLVGWSYGGYIFADYVRTFGSDALGGLVFVGAATKAGTEEAQAFLGEELLQLFGGVASPDIATRIAATRAFLPLLTHQPMGEDMAAIALAGAMLVPPEVRLAMFSRQLDNDDALARIRVPTLVIQGRDDRVVRMSAAEHIARTVPGSTLLLYDGVGHAPFFEDPARFDRDLGEFVRAARRKASP